MLVVGFIAFSLFNFVGDPVSLMLPPEATQADREQMRTALGLDKPFYVQFGTFLENAVQGNFGISLRLGRPVSALLVERLPATLELAITASDTWQNMVVPVNQLIHRFDQKPRLKDWSEVGNLHFKPKPGSDITKVLFAEFRWVEGAKKADKD